MTAENPSKLLPKLRFSEFRCAGDWQFKPLSEIAVSISDKVGAKECVPMSITTGIGLVSQEEKFGRTIAGSSYKNYIRIQTNDFAYNKSATKGFPQGYIARYSDTKDGAVPNSIFDCFRPDITAVNPQYLNHLFHRNHHGQWLRKYIMVGARAHGALSVRNDDLMSMPIPLPPEAISSLEQQKIVDCLCSLDDLIAAEGRKIEALRQHKQGLMHQLFPQPGDTVPRLRFSEFRNAGEWEPRILGQIGELIGGGTPNTSIPEYWGGDIQWFTPSDINERNLAKSERTITCEGLKHSSAKKLPVGALLITTRATIGDVGIADKPCATNQGFQSLVVFEHEVNFFWYYWLVQHKCELIRRASGSTFLEIGKKDLKQIPTLRPNRSEQQKIADCLGSLDDLIVAEGRKLETLQQHKQGLMQQLFPSL